MNIERSVSKLKASLATLPRETIFGPVVQWAWHAPDIETAACDFAKELEAGPFFQLSHIALSSSLYRGSLTSFDHSSAYGQYGDLMIELIHQHDDVPSAIRDMYDAQSPGWHHAAVFVDDVKASLEDANGLGMACVLDAYTEDGVRFAMIDARKRYNLVIEFYEPVEKLIKFYGFIRKKAIGWSGEAPLRTLE